MSDFSPMLEALRSQASARERTKIEVPEWADTPCGGAVYAQPYTLKDDQAISSYLQRDDSAGFAEIVIRKCEDADGNKLFKLSDKPALMRVSTAAVIKRVAIEIMASQSVEDVEKE